MVLVGGEPIEGSPPQVWGNLITNQLADLYQWFTPTGVGKPAAPSTGGYYAKVHPHRCGETRLVMGWRGRRRGSPPQVWGNPRHKAGLGWGMRFTPTGVGKPFGGAGRPGHRQVHPHRCGETLQMTAVTGMCQGSPPQVWGNPGYVRGGPRAGRFTPTGVGKPFQSAARSSLCPVHPHRCGETPIACPFAMILSGSPPQVWGNH